MIKVAAAVIFDGKGNVLLCSRPVDKPPAGWEFPGGKLEPGETVQQAAIRELKEELNWNILPLDIIYQLKKNNIMLYFVRVIPADQIPPVPCENQEIKWVELTEKFPPDMLPSDLEFWKFISSR